MLDIKFIRENLKEVEEAAKNKGFKVDIVQLLKLDEERRRLIGEIDSLRSEQKKLGQEDIDEAKKLKERIKELEPKLVEINRDYRNLLLMVPNLPSSDVKIGKDETENEVIKKVGEVTEFDFKPQDYMALAKKYDLIDTERAAKVSGSRFGYLKREAAELEMALVNYALGILKKEGFAFVIPPVMIKEKAMQAMGYLEHGGKEEIYHLEKDNLYLVGTSEQSIGPMHLDETIEEKDLPLKYASFSTCFRREAGSYGKDTTGILRVHQFDKIEMFVFAKPEESDKELDYLLSLEEKIMQGLEIPYQVVKMCTGDLGLPAAKKYDLEAWLPGQKRYRETHSTSNCTDFQARRLNIKYKTKDGNKYLHTLNGTAVAIGRALIAIFENYQQKDGSIKIPKVLQKYCGFKSIPQK